MKSLIRLVPFISPYRWRIVAGFVTFFVARFFEINTYYLVSKGLDTIKDTAGGVLTDYSLGQITLGIVACVFLRFVFVVHARREIRRVGYHVSYDLRQQLYQSVQVQGPDFFGRIGVGDIMTRAIQDISLIQRLIAFGAIQLVIMVYAPLYAITYMVAKSPSLTLLILPLLPAIFVYAWWVSKEMAVTSRVVQERLSGLSSHVQENLGGIRTVQAQAQEENEIKRFWETNSAYGQAFFNQARVQSLMMAWMPLFASGAQLVIVVYGGSLVLDGAMTVGDLLFFMFCVNMLLQPIRMAGMFITLLQRGAVATDRLYEIFDWEPEIQDTPSQQTPALIRGEFELKNLTFTYPRADAPVLEDINLHIAAGESIGIVGRVGSGKSTLLKQFTRMVNTNRGQLILDGHDVCDYPLAQLRSQIAQVLQDPFLFGEPLRNNISYDDPERNLEVIWDSAEAAALSGTINEMPAQMDTVVGERGVTLSGGQKQRTTLARGLIRNAPVLILDDCFSSVDTETEEHILGRLKQLRQNKTTILVSHRVSTLRHCDRIVVMDEGNIVELGTHEELLRKDGLYAALERIQTQGADPRKGLEDLELAPV
ncbi:MAG: ABC transporter ATP-binding protein [Pseudomonadota bacterium]